MKDVFGAPQSILIFGGNSEIAMEGLRKLLTLNRVKRLFLVTRDGKWLHQGTFESIPGFSDLEVQIFKMSEFSTVNSLGENKVDLCIVATGFLPHDNNFNLSNVSQSIEANFSLPAKFVTEMTLLMKKQGYGSIFAISSVAAVRIRPDNWIYGVCKSAFDNFLIQLIPTLKGSGVNILVLRPGMVRTKMSSHLKEAPLTVDAEVVAEAIMRNLRSKSGVIWIPEQMKFVAALLRILPMWLLKRMKE